MRSPREDPTRPVLDHRRFSRRLAVRVVVAALAGVSAAVVTLWLDQLTALTLPIPASNSQVLQGTFAGAILTIAVFALWMRAVVVGLTSSQASPRVLAGYLEDGFQRTLSTWMLASFAYLTAVMAALPPRSAGGVGVPAISSVTSLAVVMAAFGGLLIAIHNATSRLSMPQLIRALADQAFAVMAEERSPDDPIPPTSSAADRTVLRAPQMGWIQDIDHHAVVAHLPPGATLRVSVNRSEFVAEGDPVARADTDLDGALQDRIMQGLTIVPTRASQHDLAYAIQQLTDVAEHAMTPSSLDTSAAYEALVHLRAVLHHLIHRGTPTGSLRGPDGRWVVTERAWRPADHLRVTFQRLVINGAANPVAARPLRSTLLELRRSADEAGDADSQQVLDDQLARLREIADDVLVEA